MENGNLSVSDPMEMEHQPPFMYSMSRLDRFGDWSWANGFRTPVNIFTLGGHTWDLFVPSAQWNEHPDYFAMDQGGKRMKPTGENNLLPGRDRSSAVVKRLGQPPKLDGKLGDPAWQTVPPLALNEIALGQVEASTRVRATYDDQNFYAAFECEEPQIDLMKIRDCQRDGPVWRTECVDVVIDPYAEGVKYLHFLASPHPTGIYDGRLGYIDDPLHPLVLKNQEDTSWNPPWQHAFHVDVQRRRWTIELAIPFSTLGVPAPKPGDSWRVNFARERNRHTWEAPSLKDVPQQIYTWSPNLQKVSIGDPTRVRSPVRLSVGKIPGDRRHDHG